MKKFSVLTVLGVFLASAAPLYAAEATPSSVDTDGAKRIEKSASVQQQDTQVKEVQSKQGPVFFKVSAGAYVPQNVGIHGGGLRVPVDPDIVGSPEQLMTLKSIKYGVGSSVSALAGYDINEYVSTVVSLGYAWAPVEHVRVGKDIYNASTGTDITHTSVRDVKASGTLQTINTMVGVRVKPLAGVSAFQYVQPYVGLDGGASYLDQHAKVKDGIVDGKDLNFDRGHLYPVAAGELGVSIPVSQFVNAGLEYQLSGTWSNDKVKNNANADFGKYGNLWTHTVSANVAIAF